MQTTGWQPVATAPRRRGVVIGDVGGAEMLVVGPLDHPATTPVGPGAVWRVARFETSPVTIDMMPPPEPDLVTITRWRPVPPGGLAEHWRDGPDGRPKWCYGVRPSLLGWLGEWDVFRGQVICEHVPDPHRDPPPEWFPADTAPRDGTPFIARKRLWEDGWFEFPMTWPPGASPYAPFHGTSFAAWRPRRAAVP